MKCYKENMWHPYSSERKAHQSVQAYDPQASHYANPEGELDTQCLPQTDIAHVNDPLPHIRSPFEKPLKKLLLTIRDSVGCVHLTNSEPVGSCVLISANCVLLARHVIEGIPLANIVVRFGYYLRESGAKEMGTAHIVTSIIESDIKLDYVILSLEMSRPYPYVQFDYTKLSNNTSLALLHYPLGQPMKVSVHGIDERANAIAYVPTLHDTDFGSSGGAYFTPSGKLVAIHLGCQVEEHIKLSFNVWRYATPISEILRQNPDGFMSRILTDELSPATYYKNSNTIPLPAADYPVSFIEIEMRENRRKREERREVYTKRQGAVERTDIRLDAHPRAEYEKKTTRELAAHFSQLGPSIFDSKNQEYTTSNKINFHNPNTGWYICYDRRGDYSTVHNENDHYVGWNKQSDPRGQDARFHFRNS